MRPATILRQLFTAALIFMTGNAFCQDISTQMNRQSKGSYDTIAVARYRQTNTLHEGKLSVNNNGATGMVIYLYQPDKPEQIAGAALLPALHSNYWRKPKHKPVLIRSDWGIQFEKNGKRSDIFFVGELCTYENGEFSISYVKVGPGTSVQ